MQSKHIQHVALFILLLYIVHETSVAQTDTTAKAYKTEKAFVIYAGGGVSFLPVNWERLPVSRQLLKKHIPLVSLRLMWHPGYLLHFGLETGWVRFYSYTIDNNGKKGTTAVNATPLLFVLSMPLTERFHVFAGTGNYLMRSTLDYETSVESNSRSLGWMLAAAYQQPLSKNFGLGLRSKMDECNRNKRRRD